VIGVAVYPAPLASPRYEPGQLYCHQCFAETIPTYFSGAYSRYRGYMVFVWNSLLGSIDSTGSRVLIRLLKESCPICRMKLDEGLYRCMTCVGY